MKLWYFSLGSRKAHIHSGMGFKQGTGFDVDIEVFEVKWKERLLFRFIKDITFDTGGEWLEKLKERCKS